MRVQLGRHSLGVPARAVQVVPSIERARPVGESVAQGQLRREHGKIGRDVDPQDLVVDEVVHLHLKCSGEGGGRGQGDRNRPGGGSMSFLRVLLCCVCKYVPRG